MSKHPFVMAPRLYLAKAGLARGDAISWIRALVDATRQGRTPRTAGQPALTEAVVAYQMERSRRRRRCASADPLAVPFTQRCAAGIAEIDRRREAARRSHIEATYTRTKHVAASLGVTSAQLIACAKRAGVEHEAVHYHGNKGGFTQYFWSPQAVRKLRRLDTIRLARELNVVREVMET